MADTFQEKVISLQQVFGYPPDNLEPRTNQMIKKSMPLVKFFPSTPRFQAGLDLFNLAPAWSAYTGLLQENGYITNNKSGEGIQLAFLADNFPTDSFTNEYGENFLQKMTNMASEGASSIAQMMGATSASEAWNAMQKNLKESGGTMSGMLATMMGGVGQLAGGLKGAASAIPAIGGATSAGINLIDRLAAGSRIDFPMVWKTSGFQPSYSLTIRLYNPFPQSKEATRRFIVGPIIAIMLMGVPRAQDSQTYTWPFLHRIECPGIFELDPGFISNITVIKGGDQQQISLQQRLGIVDIRIDIGSLYSSMMGSSLKVTSRRPTVRQYGENLTKEIKVSTREYDNKNIGTASKQETIGDRDVGLTEFGTDAFGETTGVGTGRGIGNTNISRGISPKRAATASGADDDPKSRVSAAAEQLYESLKELNPFD
jgi:hypothetical protein